MYTINTIPHVKCFVRYLPTRCFCIRNLTRSVNTVRQHFPWSILNVCSLVSLRTDATPLQSIQSSRANATPSSGTSPLASKEVTPPPPPPRPALGVSYNVLSDFTSASFTTPTPTGFEPFSNPSRPLRSKSRNGKHCVTPTRAAARERDVRGTESEEEQATMPFF